MTIEPGTVLAGRYRLEEPIGEGGMGTVWRAHHLGLDSPVAIKLVRDRALSGDDTLSRFLKEARASAKLRSPHVVQVLDSGIADGVPFIAMELLEGESLRERLARDEVLDPETVSMVIGQVARALERAHEAGIVHRDLKPGNVQLVPDGDRTVVKVLDFGIAKVVEQLDEDAETATGSVMGTPYYMSPEQLADSKRVDARADVWAVAVLAFEMLVGQRPYGGSTIGELVMAVCQKPRPVPSASAIVPQGFDAWFAKACALELDDRFADVKEAVTALEDALATPLSPDPALEDTATLGASEEVTAAMASITADREASLADAATQKADEPLVEDEEITQKEEPEESPEPEPVQAVTGISTRSTVDKAEPPAEAPVDLVKRYWWLAVPVGFVLWKKFEPPPEPPPAATTKSVTSTKTVTTAPPPVSATASAAAPEVGLAVKCAFLPDAEEETCKRETYEPWCDQSGHKVGCCAPGLAAVDTTGACACPPGGSNDDDAVANGCKKAEPFDPQWIQKAVMDRRTKLRACYEEALERNDRLSGKVTLKMVIGPHGKLFHLSIDDSSLPDAKAQACFLAVVRELELPAPPDGALSVNYPLTFSK